MKNLKTRFLSIFFFVCIAVQLKAQQSDTSIRRCATEERDEILFSRFPELQRSRFQSESILEKYINDSKERLRVGDDEVIHIPVVVHVIHNQSNGRIGGVGNPNISDEQIKSQIEVLNEDYRKKEGTNGFNTNPVGVDARIEFFLAEFDENGRATNGITRNFYDAKAEFDPRYDNKELANLISWPSDQYLNIWVCKLNGNFLGIAQFPSLTGVEGLDNSEANLENTDGVIIDFRVFGRKTGAITSSVYNLGRTTTHEIGHWLGLIHTWGFVNNSCGTDYCDDTPPTDKPYEPNPAVCQDVYSNCSGASTRVMIENYMDYSPDRCMNIFTQDQLERVKAVFALSPRRVRLLENSIKGRLQPTEKLTIAIYPNPVENGELRADISFPDYKDITVTIYDSRGLVRNTMFYQEVWSKRIKMDVGGLPSGLYILEAKINEETTTKRFVIR
jgi:hypothetical protein